MSLNSRHARRRAEPVTRHRRQRPVTSFRVSSTCGRSVVTVGTQVAVGGRTLARRQQLAWRRQIGTLDLQSLRET
jgi:hypothetical protein